MSWADTGRAWVPPSPNLRSRGGGARLSRAPPCSKGRTLTEGRGTESPFLLIGAPWLKPEAVIPGSHPPA